MSDQMVERKEITNDFIRMLREATSAPVGDHQAPPEIVGEDGRIPVSAYPYHVVYSVPGGIFWGGLLAATETNADLHYQLTTVGVTREQAEAAADRARRAILGRRTRRNANGRKGFIHPMNAIADRDVSAPGGIDFEGMPPNRIYNYAETYVLRAVSE